MRPLRPFWSRVLGRVSAEAAHCNIDMCMSALWNLPSHKPLWIVSTVNIECWMIEANKRSWLTLFWHHLYSRLSLHVLVSLYCCLNGLCLRCDWQRSDKFNLTNLSHCCGCCNCESRLPCKDRHGQMRAPQTCTDCPRPFATRKKSIRTLLTLQAFDGLMLPSYQSSSF